MINVYIGPILNGYATGWTAPMVPILMDNAQSPLKEPLTATQISWLGSIVYLFLFAAVIVGYIANIVGRRLSLIGGAVFTITSYGLLVAPNIAMLYTARVFHSIYTSVNVFLTLVYIGEMASSNIRGILLTMTAVCQNLGCILVFSVGPYIPYRMVQYLPIILTIVYIIAVFLIPESPVYYLIKGDEKSVIATLRKFGRDDDINQLSLMTEEFKVSHSSTTPIRELFTVKSNRKAFFIMLVLTTLQYISGVLNILFFATTIFESAGSSVDPNISTIIIGIIFTVGSLISPIFVDNYGRRILLLISTFGCSLCMALLGIYFYLEQINQTSVSSLKWLPLLLVIVLFFIFGIGLSTIPNTLLGEMFGPNVRTIGSSISICIGGIAGFLSTNFSFGYLLVYFGMHAIFWYFTVINILAFVFTLLFVPETKGLSLIEVENLLAK
ncbi:facilitated trehalose transporter Tret1-like isoform X2 [Galleria mellonella]|uniref:Facilitated trehalose transporter Tret1-like isoform X2 n=1 Tax=Galleria mellonella TaxID=7137 RepID=A0A6J3BX53_GALME|nr:facilitated trehalose transporter Tret1-like isoform X2 [Galleria mellonella]